MLSRNRGLITRVIFLTLCVNVVICQDLTDDRISVVKNRLADAAKESWELGTRAQTLLELDAPQFSVFSRNKLPPPNAIPSNTTSAIAPVFTIARNITANRAKSNGNITGPQPLMKDGSAADPASNGVAVLLANWTSQGGEDYAGAAKDQLDYLLQVVPKTRDGAFSHRVSEVQLWSDFVYMVPPFLAYYGVLTRNQSLVSEAYNQIKLYRNYLRDNQAHNLWKHVLMGSSGVDEGHWSTGNAWAAAGMMRVLATIQNSEYDKKMAHQQADLAHWAAEIHSGMYANLDSTNIFANYADRPVNQSGNFYDAASTALLASSVYRVSLYWGDHSHIPNAQRCRETLFADNGNQSHITSDGWLQPVVNPHSYGVQGSHSPEGQAFVLELQAAYRDWLAEGAKGANGTSRLIASSSTPWMWACIIVGVLILT